MKGNIIVFYKQTLGNNTSVVENFTDNKPHSTAYISQTQNTNGLQLSNYLKINNEVPGII